VPLNGSGGVTQPSGSVYPATANTLIESAKANTSIADIYTILGSALYKDGQQVTTARIPFASGIQTDTVTEKTSDTGVTLDSVLLKDGRIDTTQGADIVCAATINLETATGNVVDVTGSTGPVTAITLSQGHWRLVRFTGTPTITNGASLVLPTAADYTCTAGDYILFVGYASSMVRAYIFPTSGPIPFVDSQPVIVGSSDKTKKVRFEADGLTTGNTRVLTVPDHNATIANFPAGFLAPYAGTTEPDGWLFAYGQAISRTTYAALFTAISTTYGAGDGSTTFNVPDLRGRVVAGQDDMGGTSANRLTDQSGGLDGDTLGDTGGSETHTLITSETPPLQQGYLNRNVTGTGAFLFAVGGSDGSATVGGGGGGAHNNVQPTIILNYLIKT